MRAPLLGHSATLVAILVSGVTACASAVTNDDGAHGIDATSSDSLPRGDAWQGYIESYMFRSGSDHVSLVFDPASGDGPRTGIVILGEGAAPAPPTDPSIAYPPSFDPDAPSLFVEGFHYPIASARDRLARAGHDRTRLRVGRVVRPANAGGAGCDRWDLRLRSERRLVAHAGGVRGH